MVVVAVGDTEARVSSVIDEYLLLTESTEDTGGEKVLTGNVDFGTEDHEVLNSSDAKTDEKGARKRKKSVSINRFESSIVRPPSKRSSNIPKRALGLGAWKSGCHSSR
mmetsp:Transcript_9601/g.41360  ORF Transcript_9601/g.41360 Transcript_9601/m.41360 type:complete len:108 (-) Transcript_9601:725-1048(-)